MCQPRRDPQQLVAGLREVDPVPDAKSRRTPAQVYSYIKNLTDDGAYQFALGTYLIVQAPHDIVDRKRVVVLNKTLANSHFRHRPFVVALQEKPSCVAMHLRLENEHPRQRGFSDLHGRNDRLVMLSEHFFA